MTDNAPLVTVLTPVYNGETYLAECIESVLAQKYTNFEYIIVNNASTDETREIAERYARIDKRIRMFHNAALLDVIASHNRAFRLISADSYYVKVVSADDRIYPECLLRMVEVFEENPSVGIVGCCQLSEGMGTSRIKWAARPFPDKITPGHDMVRAYLTGVQFLFGSPTSLMYRADLVRKEEKFYPNSSNEADTSAVCRCLLESDFGFAQQVLAYERVREGRISSRSESLNAYLSSELSDLQTYGPAVLSPAVQERRSNQLMQNYYTYLAVMVFKRRERSFWIYHGRRLAELGHPFSFRRLAGAVFALMRRAVREPELMRKLPIWRSRET